MGMGQKGMPDSAKVLPMFDSNGDGTISKEEWYQGIQSTGIQLSSKDADDVWAQLDSNGNELIDVEELGCFLRGGGAEPGAETILLEAHCRYVLSGVLPACLEYLRHSLKLEELKLHGADTRLQKTKKLAVAVSELIQEPALAGVCLEGEAQTLQKMVDLFLKKELGFISVPPQGIRSCEFDAKPSGEAVLLEGAPMASQGRDLGQPQGAPPRFEQHWLLVVAQVGAALGLLDLDKAEPCASA